MATVKLHTQLQRAKDDLVGTNNQFLAVRDAINAVLVRLAALSGAGLVSANTALTEMGIDPADFHALEASIDTVVTAVDANLTFIKTKFS